VRFLQDEEKTLRCDPCDHGKGAYSDSKHYERAEIVIVLRSTLFRGAHKFCLTSRRPKTRFE
jgi:hypothetical protein